MARTAEVTVRLSDEDWAIIRGLGDSIGQKTGRVYLLTCKSFQVTGESITDCILKWNKYRHNVDNYADTLISSITTLPESSQQSSSA